MCTLGLSLEQVSYSYAEGTPYAVEALSGIDLDIEPGSLTVILGRTGSGKSTLLRVAVGLMAPSEGSVTLEGTLVSEPIAGELGGAGLVFQSPEAQLFAETVAADVAFGPLNQGLSEEEAYKIAEESMRAVDLEPDEFALRSPFSLSGGEARRVALAGVLATRPAYLFLDEPTAGLDVSGRDALAEILRDARAQAGVVVVTHDAEGFLEHADHVLVLDAGKALFSGTVDQLIAAHEVVAKAGLKLPDVIRVQLAAIDRGVDISSLTFDPIEAASLLAEAEVWRA